jgi:hypothetical protein
LERDIEELRRRMREERCEIIEDLKFEAGVVGEFVERAEDFEEKGKFGIELGMRVIDLFDFVESISEIIQNQVVRGVPNKTFGIARSGETKYVSVG